MTTTKTVTFDVGPETIAVSEPEAKRIARALLLQLFGEEGPLVPCLECTAVLMTEHERHFPECSHGSHDGRRAA